MTERADTNVNIEVTRVASQVVGIGLRIDREDHQIEVTAGLKTEPGVRLDTRLSELANRTDVDEFSLEER